MPSARIELATHGFSVRCSTTELTRQNTRKLNHYMEKKIFANFFWKKSHLGYNRENTNRKICS